MRRVTIAALLAGAALLTRIEHPEHRLRMNGVRLRLGQAKHEVAAQRGWPRLRTSTRWEYADGLVIWFDARETVSGIRGTVLTDGPTVMVTSGQEPPKHPRGWKLVSGWGSCWGMIFSSGYRLPGDFEGTLFIQGGLEPLAVRSFSYWPVDAQEPHPLMECSPFPRED